MLCYRYRWLYQADLKAAVFHILARVRSEALRYLRLDSGQASGSGRLQQTKQESVATVRSTVTKSSGLYRVNNSLLV